MTTVGLIGYDAVGCLFARDRIAQDSHAEIATTATAAAHEAPYPPLGQILQPTAYGASLLGVLPGFATFWNVRPT